MSIIKLSKQMVDPRVLGRTTYKMEHIIYITQVSDLEFKPFEHTL